MGQLHTAASPAGAQLHGCVLLAQHGHDSRMFTSAMLGALGLDVLLAADGASAVELALAEQVDVVMMDLAMPVMDGMQATAVLRACGMAVPVVALSGAMAPGDVRRYLGSGFSHCLHRPVAPAALACLLRQLLGAPTPVRSVLADLPEYAQMCALFAQHWPQQLAALASYGAAGQWQALAALAHQIKGSAGSFGHARAGRLADQIERCVRQDDQAGATRALAALLALEDAAPRSAA